MRILKILSILAFGSLLAAPDGFAQECNKTGVIKPGFTLQTNAWFPTAFENDFFNCGPKPGTTPATCLLANRVWTDEESSCVNSQIGGPDFIPYVFDTGTTNFQRYELDQTTPSNWPGPELGKDGQAWYVAWDYMVDPGLASCKGFYGVQSDILQQGETGDPRIRLCEDGALGLSCVGRLIGGIANKCNQVDTVDGTVTNQGALAAVPIPIITDLSSVDFTTAGASITLGWVPACNFIVNDGAPNPLMGYLLEVFVDDNNDGACTPPTGCDADSASFQPLAEIAPEPVGGSGIAPLFFLGGRTSPSDIAARVSVPIEMVDMPLTGTATLGDVDCLVFRTRIMFQDDRNSTTGFGIDSPISPVLSLVSGRSARVQQQALAALISAFAGDFGKGTSVDLSWRVSSDSFDTFRVSKSAEPNGTFRLVGEVDAVSNQLTYELTDADAFSGIEKSQGKPTVWYLLEASGIGGTETAGPIPIRRGKN